MKFCYYKQYRWVMLLFIVVKVTCRNLYEVFVTINSRWVMLLFIVVKVTCRNLYDFCYYKQQVGYVTIYSQAQKLTRYGFVTIYSSESHAETCMFSQQVGYVAIYSHMQKPPCYGFVTINSRWVMLLFIVTCRNFHLHNVKVINDCCSFKN